MISDDEHFSPDIHVKFGNGYLDEDFIRGYNVQVKREDAKEFRYWCQHIPYHQNSIRRIEKTHTPQILQPHYLMENKDQYDNGDCQGYYYDKTERVLSTREWNLLKNNTSW